MSADLDARTARVELLFELYRSASAMDPGAPSAGSPAGSLALSERLRALLGETLSALGGLQESCDAPGGPDLDLDGWGDHLEETHAGGEPASVARALDTELWATVGNLCFTARGELRQAERGLPASVATHEERLAWCERARRKLRRAGAAILEAAGRASGRSFPIASSREADTEAALAVRRMYSKFRFQLVRCDTRDAAAVRRALRHAAVSLAKMIAHDDFAEVRASDRTLLHGLQARILAWAREGASEPVGLRLYLDLVATGDLLRSINLRQELQTHDAGALAELERARAERDATTMLRLMRRLEGLDAGLDELLVRARAGEPVAAFLADAVAGLRGMHAGAR